MSLKSCPADSAPGTGSKGTPDCDRQRNEKVKKEAMIVDCHVHLYPPEINRAPQEWAKAHRESHWEMLCARIRKDGRPVQSFPSLDELLGAMDAARVERAILQGWYWENHDTCRLQNRFYADCLRQHPDRLSACATFHPAAGEKAVLDELTWTAQNGFCGIGEMSPHSQGFSVEDPVWNAALVSAGRLHLPVVLHVTEALTKPYPGRILTPLADFTHLARTYPGTNFVLAHWGARLPFDSQWTESNSSCNIFFDTAASPLLYDLDVFREMTAAVGAERILFGSDFPLILFPNETQPSIAAFVEKVRALNLAPKDWTAIFQTTAKSVFKLP